MDAANATPQREWPAGWHVQLVDETGSTNADLLAAAAAGAPDRSVLAAAHQLAGRGRLDRTWVAPPNSNLLVSLLFRQVPEHPHELTRRAALAARRVASQAAGVEAELKWPNDVLVSGAKLAGVLAQSGGAGGIDYVVVGVGLNVRWAPEGAAKLGEHLDPLDVLAHLLRAYDELPGDVSAQYRSALGTIGRRVVVRTPTGAIEGRAVDVEPDGRLVVVDECAITHRFDSGDVLHLR
jgi:BirA family transcriptional regulator, biotin operon repressor / biotin---[acetyl-CoA-carboxylase] ligase